MFASQSADPAAPRVPLSRDDFLPLPLTLTKIYAIKPIADTTNTYVNNVLASTSDERSINVIVPL